MTLDKNETMKNYILTIGTLLFLISCGNSEKQIRTETIQDTIAVNSDKVEVKELETTIYNYEKDSDFSEEMDLDLLGKVATNLKIQNKDIVIDNTNSISYNDKFTFFVISYKADTEEKGPGNDGEVDNYFERKYVFVNKIDGKILDQELDQNLCFFENEAGQPSNTYIFKKLIKLNEIVNGIGLSTEFSSSSRISLWSEQKFTIIALINNKIQKILYEYPIRKTQGESNGGGTFQMESLKTSVGISNKKNNGFFDLKIAKTFSYEDEIEEDLEKGIKAKVEPIKIKKETEIIQYNGKIYSFKTDDTYRFLKDYN